MIFLDVLWYFRQRNYNKKSESQKNTSNPRNVMLSSHLSIQLLINISWTLSSFWWPCPSSNQTALTMYPYYRNRPSYTPGYGLLFLRKFIPLKLHAHLLFNRSLVRIELMILFLVIGNIPFHKSVVVFSYLRHTDVASRWADTERHPMVGTCFPFIELLCKCVVLECIVIKSNPIIVSCLQCRGNCWCYAWFPLSSHSDFLQPRT